MEDTARPGLERVADMMADCQTVNPSAYCDTSGGGGGDKVPSFDLPDVTLVSAGAHCPAHPQGEEGGGAGHQQLRHSEGHAVWGL